MTTRRRYRYADPWSHRVLDVEALRELRRETWEGIRGAAVGVWLLTIVIDVTHGDFLAALLMFVGALVASRLAPRRRTPER